jgi:hypothetical protein
LKIKNFLSFDTLKITFPIGKTILFALLIFLILPIAIEGLLKVIPIPEYILVPTYNREIMYPEMDIKLSRLSSIEIKKKINCFLLGNSMVDFGLNPTILNSQPILRGNRYPVCFNMAQEFMMPETTSEFANILNKRSKPSLFILGVSPIDFVGGENITRKYVTSPWFKYQKGIESTEGWWIENSATYRYWLSFLKHQNPEFGNKIANMNLLIDPYGFQIRENDHILINVQKKVRLPDFAIREPDLSAFIRFLELNSTETQIIVVEMPVHPDFLQYYIPGGEEGYEEHFIQPIKMILDQKRIPFIRSQPQIASIISSDGWVDYGHFNEEGADQFSGWLVTELVSLNNPKNK